MGIPRLTEAGDETGMVDVISPLNQQIMATFHEKTPGVWVQHVNPVETTTTTTTLDVATSISLAQKLLDGLGPSSSALANRRSNRSAALLASNGCTTSTR